MPNKNRMQIEKVIHSKKTNPNIGIIMSKRPQIFIVKGQQQTSGRESPVI